jgi:hypothetical protein
MHRDFAGGFDAQANLVTTDFQDGEHNVRTDDQAFARLAAEYEHLRVSFRELENALRRLQ